jgi:prepilin-type N-terminal cleavage/methylation domain-containing protein
MKNNSYTKNKGFTIIELMIAIGVAAILTAYAIPAYRDFGIRQNIINQSNNLIGDLTFARVHAINLGRTVLIQAKTESGQTTWKNGWIIFIDKNANNNFDDGTDEKLRDTDKLSETLETSGPSVLGFSQLGSKAKIVNLQSEVIELKNTNISYEKKITIAISGMIN